MHISRTICIAAVLGLAACASQSAYRAADDPDDHGYYSRTLGNDRYIVGYNGSSTMSENLVKDYALFRAAELTMQEGKDWFRVVERESRSVDRRGERYASRFGLRGAAKLRPARLLLEGPARHAHQHGHRFWERTDGLELAARDRHGNRPNAGGRRQRLRGRCAHEIADGGHVTVPASAPARIVPSAIQGGSCVVEF
jgi:hypothetical protein